MNLFHNGEHDTVNADERMTAAPVGWFSSIIYKAYFQPLLQYILQVLLFRLTSCVFKPSSVSRRIPYRWILLIVNYVDIEGVIADVFYFHAD